MCSFRALVDLVLPRSCGGCGREGSWWCARCDAVLRRPARGFLVADPLGRSDAPPLAVTSCAAYRGPVGSALVALKERGVGALAPVLGGALAGPVRDGAGGRGGGDRVLLVPVPSRARAVRSRGADVVADLARSCALRLREDGWDVSVVRALVHKRRVRDQAGLDVAERASNLAGALAVRRHAAPLLRASTVLLVDDVLTTGSSLLESARAVRAAASVTSLAAVTVAAAGTYGAAFPSGAAARVVEPDEADSPDRALMPGWDG